MSIRYETEDVVGQREAGEDRGATALDPDAMERPQSWHRPSNGIPLDAGRGPGSQPTRRSSALPMDPARRSSNAMTTDLRGARRNSAMTTDPLIAHRNSPAPMESMGGITRPYQRPRGKKRVSELDPGPTQTFGPADPLPPSPAAREQTEGWFRPSLLTESIPDLSALAGDTNRTYDPHMHNHSLPGLPFYDEVESAAHPPAQRSFADLQARPWLFSALLAATCLAVGMVLGALLFGSYDGSSAPSERNQVVIRCSDPPAR